MNCPLLQQLFLSLVVSNDLFGVQQASRDELLALETTLSDRLQAAAMSTASTVDAVADQLDVLSDQTSEKLEAVHNENRSTRASCAGGIEQVVAP